MKVLGIETSCDETASAVVENGRLICSNVAASSLKEHSKYGGIIPEIASRRQLEFINDVVAQALKSAGLKCNGIDAIAVTGSPGLIGSLLVGISFAKALSFSLNKPLVEVDHITAHLYANFLTTKQDQPRHKLPKLPAIGLVVSGGHTSLFYMSTPESFKSVGQTLDDAAGEAFDKVARLLELGYPGGPVIDRVAPKGKNTDIRFTCAQLPGTLDFSFSGIKTAVLYHKQKHRALSPKLKAKIAYSFQESVTSVLASKSISACKKLKTDTLLLGGGVAANSSLREKLRKAADESGIGLHYPPINLCIDNAAMIAGLGYHQLKKGATVGR